MPLDFPSFSDSLASYKSFKSYSEEIASVISKVLGNKKNPFRHFEVGKVMRRNKAMQLRYEALGNSTHRVPYIHHEHKIDKRTIRKLWMMSQDEDSVFLFMLAYLSGISALSENPKRQLFLELEGKIIPINNHVFDRDEILKIITGSGGILNYQAGIEDISFKRNKDDIMKVRVRIKNLPNGTRQEYITLKTPIDRLLDQYPDFLDSRDESADITHSELQEFGERLKLVGEEEFVCNDVYTFTQLLQIDGYERAKLKNKLRDSYIWQEGHVELDQFVNGMPLFIEPEGNQDVVFSMMNELGILNPEICRVIDSGTKGVHQVLGFEDKLLRVGEDGRWDKETLIRADKERKEIDKRMAQGYY